MSQINIIGISGYIGSGKDTIGGIIQDLTSPNDYGGFVDLPSPWRIKKFADKLKQIAAILTGIPREKFEDQEFKASFLGPEWSTKEYNWGLDPLPEVGQILQDVPMTVRKFLQTIGTDALRDKVHENIWVNALFSDFNPFPKEKYHSGNFIEENSYLHPKCRSCGKKYFGYKRQTRCKDCIEKEGEVFPKWLITDCRFPNEAEAIKSRGGIIIRVHRNTHNSTDKKHFSETALDHYDFDYDIWNNGSMHELKVRTEDMLRHYQILK